MYIRSHHQDSLKFGNLTWTFLQSHNLLFLDFSSASKSHFWIYSVFLITFVQKYIAHHYLLTDELIDYGWIACDPFLYIHFGIFNSIKNDFLFYIHECFMYP